MTAFASLSGYLTAHCFLHPIDEQGAYRRPGALQGVEGSRSLPVSAEARRFQRDRGADSLRTRRSEYLRRGIRLAPAQLDAVSTRRECGAGCAA